jgi:hypothetical protein
MHKEKSNFLPPGEPTIIVRRLTIEIIQEAIEAYTEKYLRIGQNCIILRHRLTLTLTYSINYKNPKMKKRMNSKMGFDKLLDNL